MTKEEYKSNCSFSIKVERLTDWKLVADAARTTVWKGELAEGKEPSDKFKESICQSEHSPLRCLMYKVTMKDIPSFVSTHLVRHKYGVEHFVSSNRADRNGGNEDITRWNPVNHMMVVNAQELMFMARRRLCATASKETQDVMWAIKREIEKIDPIVAKHMIRMCEYRHECGEGEHGCKWWKTHCWEENAAHAAI